MISSLTRLETLINRLADSLTACKVLSKYLSGYAQVLSLEENIIRADNTRPTYSPPYLYIIIIYYLLLLSSLLLLLLLLLLSLSLSLFGYCFVFYLFYLSRNWLTRRLMSQSLENAGGSKNCPTATERAQQSPFSV